MRFERELSAFPEVMDAYNFARRAHDSVAQVRAYTGEPYIVHPVEVACIVAAVPHSREMLMASLLHDVVEDTPVSLDEIRARFGSEVAVLVGWLTKSATQADGAREARARIELARLAQAPGGAHTIKTADILANCTSLPELDPRRAERYLPEKLELLEVLVRGDEALRCRAIHVLSAGLAQARRSAAAISGRGNPSGDSVRCPDPSNR